MKKFKIFNSVLLLSTLVMYFVAFYAFYLLWNNIMPRLGLPNINYWESAGLVIIIWISLGGVQILILRIKELRGTKLSRREEERLVSYFKRFKFPVGYNLFKAIMGSFVSTPVELAVFNKEGEVLLIYRKDDEFDGYHSPGTVLLNDEDVPTALKRLQETELQGLEITPPVGLGWHENTKGPGFFQNPTRHEISLIHACTLISGEYKGDGHFFSKEEFFNRKREVVPHHRKLVPEIYKRFKEYKKNEKRSQLFQ